MLDTSQIGKGVVGEINIGSAAEEPGQTSQTLQLRASIVTAIQNRTLDLRANIQTTTSNTLQLRGRISVVATPGLQLKAAILQSSDHTLDLKATLVIVPTRMIRLRAHLTGQTENYLNLRARVNVTAAQTLQLRAAIIGVAQTTLQTSYNILVPVSSDLLVNYHADGQTRVDTFLSLRARILRPLTTQLAVSWSVDYDMPTECQQRPTQRLIQNE